ncbi:hypothetical protein F2Q70_00038836 [Brassica cretica]|uniref:Aspartic peptidase DDI1-type domain-containing protein n=1 Tax=Brassica cretica TaxID=69181 RepID=A0A8S9K5D8_BRACR|nr:hypothetical protein F2Q70_00038836 [Brassica cretica]
MFHQVREKMRQRITLKKKSDPGKFVVPCLVGGIDYPSALCDTGSAVNILPKSSLPPRAFLASLAHSRKLAPLKVTGSTTIFEFSPESIKNSSRTEEKDKEWC